MYTPVNPSFTIYMWGVRGYKSHGHVILMLCLNCLRATPPEIEQANHLHLWETPICKPRVDNNVASEQLIYITDGSNAIVLVVLNDACFGVTYSVYTFYVSR